MKSRHLLLVSILLIAGTAIGANAQSQDRDNPTALAANAITGGGIGKKVEYYYSFTAGPGEIIVTVDLKAKSGSTNADVEIFDADSKVFYYYPNATSTNEHAVKKFTLNSEQPLTLRLALDASAGPYSIKLAGPIQLATVPPAGETSAAGEQPQPPTDVPLPDTANTTPADSSTGTTGKSGKNSKLDFGLDLLQAAGKHFGLPTSGMLHIVMKDGTTQDIDLSQVKTAKVNKQ
jgi:hypothetical protein